MRKKLKIKMIEKDVKGVELARLTGISNTVLSQIVTGRVNPTKDEVKAICDVLDVSDSVFDDQTCDA